MSNKEKIESLKKEVDVIKKKIAEIRNQDNGTCRIFFIIIYIFIIFSS